MDRNILNLLIVSLIVLSVTSISPAQSQIGSTLLDKVTFLKGKKISEGFFGFGVQNNIFLYTSSNNIVTEEQKNAVEEYITHLNPKIVRIFLDTRWWDPTGTRKYIWEWEKSGILGKIEKELGRPPEYSISIKALYRILNFYKKLNTPINLVMWRPNDLEVEQLPGMINSVTDLLKYLIKEKGFSNIRYLTLYNEPDAEFRSSPKNYVDMYKLMAERLKESQLEIQLIGGDTTQNGVQFLNYTISNGIGDIIDGFSFHQYIKYNIPIADYLRNINKIIKEIHRVSNKPIGIWEFNIQGEGAGTYTCGNIPDLSKHILDEYSSSITLSEYILQCLKTGITGMCYWEVYDMNYPGGYKMECGLIGYNNGWEIRPFFYVYQLFTHLVEPGAIVYNIIPELEGITSILIENIEGRIKESLFIVNSLQKSITVNVENIFYEDKRVNNSQWILQTITQKRIEELIYSGLLDVPTEHLNSIPSNIEIPSRGIVVLSRYL